MTQPTPNVQGDLKAKLTALLPADFPSPRVFVGGEVPGAASIAEATWIKYVSEVVEEYDEVGGVRHLTCQVKRRVDHSRDPSASLAHAAMVRLYDAVNGVRGLGAWTGASAFAYVDVRARSFPQLLEETYVVMDITVTLDTPS